MGSDRLQFCGIVHVKVFFFKIAWIKVKTQSILTMDKQVITRNSRISISQREGDLWQLTIRNVRPSDQGLYMCQTNTDPMESQVGYLEVTGMHKIIKTRIKR